MEILEQRQGAVTVVKPIGPLVGGDAESFKMKLDDALDRSLGRLVLDAAELAFVDSRGLEVLKEATDQLSRSGQSLRVCGANETLREVLELTGIAEHFEQYQDVGSGVRSFL